MDQPFWNYSHGYNLCNYFRIPLCPKLPTSCTLTNSEYLLGPGTRGQHYLINKMSLGYSEHLSTLLGKGQLQMF